MDFGLDVAQHQLTWDELLARTRFAEEAGFTGAWLFDHFKALYGDPNGPCMEAWTLLAGLAAATERIRLGALVTGMTYRHPSILATEAVTVDHISGGRLELAVGAGWFEQEHNELGIPFPDRRDRVDRFAEGLEVLRLLLTQDGATFAGRHYRLEDATYRPRPVQQPTPPLWIGAGGERMLRLAGRYADVWHSFGPAAEIARKGAIVDEHAEAAGRGPVRRATNLSLSDDLDAVKAGLDARAEAGVTYVVASWPEEGQAKVEAFAREVMPAWAG
jgi:F420-dependent oxidoreductase-like protein